MTTTNECPNIRCNFMRRLTEEAYEARKKEKEENYEVFLKFQPKRNPDMGVIMPAVYK